MTASVSQVQSAIDEAAKGTGFKCVPVSWEDAQRGTVGGALSCWGGNISDVRLWDKSGALLYTCRTENWNERLGYVAAKEVAVVTGNHIAAVGDIPRQPKAVTLQSYLKAFGEYAGYAGVTSTALYDPSVDDILSIRFQTVFLPVAEGKTAEFCTEVYNYNTTSNDDPRNVALLCTAQGTSVQQDGAGAQKVFHHEVDEHGKVVRYYLEAERSEHKVGGAQKETQEEALAAAARGKSTAIHIGTRAMGTRFNVQMLIQLPLKQKQKPPQRMMMFESYALGAPKMAMACAAPMPSCAVSSCAPMFRSGAPKAPVVGVSNAARVSRGKQHDVWGGVARKDPERDPSMHGTITVTMYYTVVGGVPSAADVKAAIADLDALYKACPTDKRLVDCTELTKELTVKDTIDISKKLTTQPYKPPAMAPADNSGGFPE